MKPSHIIGLVFTRLSLLIPSLILGLWACVILRLKSSGLLSELQSPTFHSLSLATALCCLALALLYPLLLNPKNSSTPSRWPSLFITTLLLATPVIFFMLLPRDNPTTGFLARKYSSSSSGMNLYQLLGIDQKDLQQDLISRKEHAEPNQSIEMDMLELNFIANNSDLKKLYDGASLTLSGQYLPATDNNKNSFRLVQMIMFCCAADAKVLGINVTGDASSTPSGSWLDVSGTLHFNSNTPYLIMQATKPEDDAPPPDLPLPEN